MNVERIKVLRKEKGLTEIEMSEKIGVNEDTYTKYESGKLDIPLEAFVKLTYILDTSVDYLIGRTDERKPYPRAKH